MKNFLICFLIILVMVVACNRKENETATNEITFWHFQSEPNQKKALMEIIAEFEKENDCKIKTTELSWNDGKTKLFAAFNANTAPDVIELGSDWIAQFSSTQGKSGSILLPLDSSEFNINQYVEFSKAPSVWKGKQYALPWTVDTRVLFYNKDLLKKVKGTDLPPTSIDELLSLSEAMNNPELGIYGFGTNGSDPHRLYKKILYFVWTYGGDVFNQEGKPVFFSNETVKAFEVYKELSNFGLIETQRQLDSYFAQGKVGFWLSGGWLIDKIARENPALNYGVALVPGINGQIGTSFAGGEYLAINSNTKKNDLAKKFIKFLSKGENTLKYCEKVREAGFPADKDFYNNPMYDTIKLKKIFAEQLNYAKMTPVEPKWLDIEEIIENAVVEVLLSKKSSYEAVLQAQKQIENIINK
ncbi:MAG TPA: extracellular solute-binding protein [Candidatus Kapabacteria bacterium]|nr:extracellular solute-binding protein [Candidatus Kapabacteria bacterium]HPO63727.1 extracellular solute-binding protein [Candidatus Kapabacteria bacterium]